MPLNILTIIEVSNFYDFRKNTFLWEIKYRDSFILIEEKRENVFLEFLWNKEEIQISNGRFFIKVFGNFVAFLTTDAFEKEGKFLAKS